MATGLGVFSLALGAAEIFAGRRIAAALGTPEHAGVVQAFGAREIGSGIAILSAPATPLMVWNRVAGDVLDLASLSFAARRDPGNRAVWGATAFVLGALVLDIIVARGLERDGRSSSLPPANQRLAHSSSNSASRATSIEPAHVATPTAPQV
jgi:hypothetical protein